MLSRGTVPLQAILAAELQGAAAVRAWYLWAQAPPYASQVLRSVIMFVVNVTLHVPFGPRCMAAGVDGA